MISPLTSSAPRLRAILPGRSCTACKRRKIRCDRARPNCAYCVRLDVKCSYPIRKVRDRRRQPVGTLHNDDSGEEISLGEDVGIGVEEASYQAKRLKANGSIGVDVERAVAFVQPPPIGNDATNIYRVNGDAGGLATHATDTLPQVLQRLERVESELRAFKPKCCAEGPATTDHGHSSYATRGILQQKTNLRLNGQIPNSKIPHGHLVTTDSTSRYVEASLWSTIEAEAAILSHNSNSSTTKPTEITDNSPVTLYSHPLTNPSPLQADISHLHPPPERIFPLWQVYLESVHPVLHILHAPTVQKQLLQASQNIQNAPPSFEALMFAIYYAAVTSIPGSVHGTEEKRELLDKHASGVEQALLNAKYATAPGLFGLQALTIYIICASTSGHRDSTTVSSMAATLLGLARRIGLHREPDKLEIGIFDGEMRRRLWWYIVVLDEMCAEDLGCAPGVHEGRFDTVLPRNLNDASLEPSMSVSGASSRGWTEMRFALTLFETSQKSSPRRRNSPSVPTTFQRRQEIEDTAEAELDTSTAIGAFTRTYREIQQSRTLAARLIQQSSEADTKELLHTTLYALDVLKQADSHPQRKFLWFIEYRFELEAVSLLLHCLRNLDHSADAQLVDRASKAVDEFFDDSARSGMLETDRWRLLRRMRVNTRVRGFKDVDGLIDATDESVQDTRVPRSKSMDVLIDATNEFVANSRA